MRRSRSPWPLPALLCAGLLGACGSSGPQPLDAATATGLRARFAAVQVDAAAGRRAAALASLRQASSQVDRAASAGRLTSGETSALKTGIARARARVLVEVRSAPAPAVAAAAPVAAPTPAAPHPAPGPGAEHGPKPAKGHGHGKGNGHGNGGGHGGGDGGD